MQIVVNVTKFHHNIAGKAFHPGESRPIEDSEIPEARIKGFLIPGDEPAAAAEIETPTTPVTALSAKELQLKTIKDLTDLFPTLTNAQLLDLEAAEKGAEVPRETLLKLLVKEMEGRPAK